MSLKVVRKRATGSLGLDLVMKTADTAKEVASLLSFPAASAAAAAVLAMLEIVAEVKVNRKDCMRLAIRAARVLTELGQRMEGKWEKAPKALIDNVRTFSETLISIHDFMVKASEAKWMNRLLSKSTIEDALEDYNQQLDEAAQSFQIAAIIEIHHAIGTMQQTSQTLYIEDATTLVEADTEAPSLPSQALVKPSVIPKGLDVVPVEDRPLTITDIQTEEDLFVESLGDNTTDEFGFRRYHQSEVVVRRPHRRAVGWFAGTSEAQANGNKMTVKRYEGAKEAQRRRQDVKTLRRLYHQNLPQMAGYSDGKTAVPFILLANGPTRDVGLYVQNTLNTQTSASSVRALLHVYRGITSAAMHVQQQLSLSDNQLQDFIEDASYTVDDENNVILGLPPPKDGWMTARSYNLCESLVDRALKYLKELGRLEESPLAGSATRSSAVGKIRQLQALLEALLPYRTEDPSLAPELEDLLDEDDHASISLPVLRQIALARERHGHTWQERSPAGKFQVGDYGHMPGGGKDFGEFEVLGNVFDSEGGNEGCGLEVAREVEGEYVAFGNRFPERQQARPFILPDGLEGWPLAMLPQAKVTVFARRQSRVASVNDAWKVFAERAVTLGARHGVHPHDLILITRTLNINDFNVHDWSPPALTPFSHHHPTFPPTRPGFGFGAFPPQPPLPTIIYLFTSSKPDFEPYVTDDVGGRPRPRPVHSTSWCYACQTGWPVDYVNYIQLDREDFA